VEGTLPLFDWRPTSGAGPDQLPQHSAQQHSAQQHSAQQQAQRPAAKAKTKAKAKVPATAPSPAIDLAAVAPAPVIDLATAAAPPPPLAGLTPPPAPEAFASAPDPAASAPRVRVIVFDCETTGTDRMQDQIIELCTQHGLDDDALNQTWRIKPSVPIHPGAQAVHGITLADLEGCPAFAEVADAILAVFAEADVIVGYNIAFDIEMLQAELARAGRSPLDFQGKQIVDAFRLWQQCEPRSLQHAHQRFVGNGFAAAHSASADVAATGRVLAGMLRAFNLDGQDWTQIANVCDPGRASWVGPSRHLRWEGDAIVFGFGKHAGAALHDLACGPDRGFLRWILDRPPGRDFPTHVVEVCRAALDLPRDEFLAWARRRYGTAAPTAQPPFAR
jgi:DNA polymerase-3 subunit epsilon